MITPLLRSTKQLIQLSALILALLVALPAAAQKDTIILKNNSIIDGKVKSISKDEITIETSYSGNDIAFKLSEIKKIDTKSRFLFTMKNGKSIVSPIHSNGGDSLTLIDPDHNKQIRCKAGDVQHTSDYDSGFWSRWTASVGFGLNVAKANDATQLNTRNSLGYTADKWTFNGLFNMIYTTQNINDSTTSNKMTEGEIGVKYSLPKEWFLGAKIALLSNSEQALKLRSSSKLGFGKNLVDKNSILLAVSLGASVLDEQFTNATPSKQSAEGYFSTDFKIDDVKDFTLSTAFTAYPGITEKGRWRSDIKVDIQYDLPHDFFIQGGTTFNFDNQPAAVGKEWDYNFMLTLGWKL